MSTQFTLILEELLMDYHCRATIGIPAYNEGTNLPALLKNVSRQLANSDHDIVVVSDGSSDKTSAIVNEFAATNSSVSLIVHPKRLGKAAAINSIMRAAHGDVIVLVSGDTQPAPGSISSLLQVITMDPRIGLVWAWPNPIMPNSVFLRRLGEASFGLHRRFMMKVDQVNQLRHSAGELLAFRQNIIHSLPAECVNDDTYLAWAIASKGFKVNLAPRVATKFVWPKSIAEYVKQRKRWLSGHIQTRRLTGEFPNVLEFSLLRRTKLVLETLSDELRENPRNLLYFATALLLETLVFGSIMIRAISMRHNIRWDTLKSTKAFPETYPERRA